MQIIHPRLHGALDYTVAAALIAFPIVFDFGAESTAALLISLVAGVGLAVYSALTDYAAGVRRLVPWRVHLALDAVAALGLLAAPFAFGFDGLARAFYVAVAVSVLVVVALSQRNVEAASSTPRAAPHAALAALLASTLVAVCFAGSRGHAETSPDWKPRWTEAGELVLPEGYHRWVFLGSPLTPHALNGGNAPFPEYHNVYVHPEALDAFQRTGEWPEGTILLKELQLLRPAKFPDGSSLEVSGRGYFPQARNGIDISVKDSSRFPETDGWGFFNFGHHAPPYDETATEQPAASCAGCHMANAEDMVFMKFYRPILEAK